MKNTGTDIQNDIIQYQIIKTLHVPPHLQFLASNLHCEYTTGSKHKKQESLMR